METSSQPLDTTIIKDIFKPEPLEPHEKFGEGELYIFGATRVELYSGLEGQSAVVRIRKPGSLQAFSDVVQVKLNEDGGISMDCGKQGEMPHSIVSITKAGDVASFSAAPPSPMTISENGVVKRIKGENYTQTTIAAETAEGLRVQIKGTVDAAPRLLDPKNQKSALSFFLIEDDPLHPEAPIYHEVWASNKAKQELKALKLVKGTVIEAIFYRRIFNVEFSNERKETHVRHTLVKVIYSSTKERKHSARQQKAATI